MTDSLRSACRNLLQRLTGRIAPEALEPKDGADDEAQDYAEMLLELGAEPPPREGADVLKDTTIRELTHNLHGLSDLGDRLARAEQDKLALAARVEELEAERDATSESAAVARLERKLEQREGVLARVREQLTSHRAKTEDWKSKAAERWHEIGSLRKQVKKLERALAEARDAAQPGPLPKSPASGSRQQSSGGRESSRAS